MTLGNPFLIGRREEQRLERRRAVSEAARVLENKWARSSCRCCGGWVNLDSALALPKPWSRPSRLQPSRPTRARRKHCTRLLRRQLEEARG